jgi:hypothetical protein
MEKTLATLLPQKHPAYPAGGEGSKKEINFNI